MVDHDQQNSRGERVSAKKQLSSQRQQLDSFHLLRIVCLLQKGGGGNKA